MKVISLQELKMSKMLVQFLRHPKKLKDADHLSEFYITYWDRSRDRRIDTMHVDSVQYVHSLILASDK